MRLIIQKGDLFFLNEEQLTVINKSLAWARQNSHRPMLCYIYRMQVNLAYQFLIKERRNVTFFDLTETDKDRFKRTIEAHEKFLQETKK